MECQQVGAWVPFTPLKSINGESKCKDSNFIEAVDSNGGLCDGKVEKLASSDGVEIKFGVETGESRCTEEEGQRVIESEDAEINLDCDEKLAEPMDSPSVAQKQDRKRHNDGIDLNKKPKQRPKVKKHRPKIALDRWTPRKTPKAQTPKKPNPKNLNPSTPKNVDLRGKRYLGKSGNSKGLTSTSENVKGEAISESSTCVAASCKRSLRFECEAVDNYNDVVESCNRPHQNRYHLRSVEGFSLQVSNDLSMCPDFNTENKERGERCFKRVLYHYQRRMRGVDKSSQANNDINIGTEECTNSSFTTQKKKAGCMQFYKRTFRVNQCRQNSRKSGPNFPKICKKSRTLRVKATTFVTMWSIVEGAHGVAKRRRTHGRCKQITRNFCAQINWKIVLKGARSLRKSKYQRPLSVCGDYQIEKSLLKMIMPTEEQTQAAIADPESFKCVVGLNPVAKSRGKRSLRNPLVANYNFDQLAVYTPSYRSKVYELENLVEVKLQKYESNLDDVEVQGNKRLQSDENYLDCPLNTTHFFLNDVDTHGNKRLQPDETHLDCSLNTPSFFLDDIDTHCNLQPENHLNFSLNNGLDVVVYQDENNRPQHKAVRSSQECSNYAFVRGLIDIIVKLKCLNIYDERNELVVQDPKFHGGTLVKIDPPKKRKVLPKVALDSETLRMFKLMMDNDGSEYSEDMDQGKNEWWAKEREVFRGRANSFIARMHLLQGDRSFSKWKGSVVDSVVGVYLTQNVTDVLSSSTFIDLAAKYPVKPRRGIFEDVEFISNQEELGTRETRGVDTQVTSNKRTDVKDDGDIEGVDCGQPCSHVVPVQVLEASLLAKDNGDIEEVESDSCAFPVQALEASHAFPVQDLEASLLDMDPKRNNKLDTGETSKFRKLLELEELGFLQQFYGAENDLLSHNVNMDLKPSIPERSMHTSVSTTAPFDVDVDPLGISREGEAQNKSESMGTLDLSGSRKTAHHNVSKKSMPKKISSKGEKKERTGTDWEELRKTYSNDFERGKDDDAMDAVDWEAVRNATHEELAHVIAARGMHNLIAARIKDFLERVLKDHGKIDLEWLRDIPPDDAKDFLLSIGGLGLKSVECVRLLTLHHRAFPVDTNVARVAVRLGWVPLAPLPEELKLHLLDSYPLLDKIQIYLFPRLCTLDQETLYQLHYQLITFGKVFCTKKNPNCNACPLKGECKHYASSIASSRLALPWPKDKEFVASNMSAEASDQNCSMFITPLPESLSAVKLSEADPSLSESNVLHSTYQTQNCEPIIEVPESPTPESVEPQELRDIEDCFIDPNDEIPIIRLDEKELKKNLKSILETEYMFQEGEIADALTALTKEAASVHPHKLKFIEKLKTVHQVFELPDYHPLLEKFERRVTGDPCPYLLAIWPTGVISKSFQYHSSGGSEESRMNKVAIYPSFRSKHGETIKGTILIPCRTANRGRFPLNGTYFQVNEVFADFESSEHPIDIPEGWICNLPRRSLHCGVSATTIFKGSIMEEIQYCFWRGYICLRGFDKRVRVTRQLHPRFHISPSTAGKMRVGRENT